ncbi:MAG TPA: nucleotidyltransferase [Polyangia bacterium]|jgi:hypothetical protein
MSGTLDDDGKQAVYAEGLRALVDARVPFLVGGGFALFAYLGRWRATKDIDIFLKAEVLEEALYALARAGFTVEITDATWLAKARLNGALIDIIFCSYNGLFPVDDGWIENGRAAEVLGVPVEVVGPEEMVVSKCFVAARDRFDGGDVSWLLRALGPRLDWPRIESLMRDHWQVLLWQLIHFLYVFPSERRTLPADVLARLLAQLRRELAGPPGDPRICRGPMLDPKLYRQELAQRGGDDPRPRRELVEPHLIALCSSVLDE